MTKKFYLFIILFFATVCLSGSFPGLAQAAEANLIANPSFEQSDTTGKMPADWQTGGYGNNAAVFSYLSSGRSGNKSAKVTVSKYIDGDAKWFFNPVAVKPAASYNFVDYYQSTASTDVVARYSDNNGVFSYQYLGSPAKKRAWTKASYSFKTPENSVSLTVFHFVRSNGYLVTDDYSLSEIPKAIITANVPNNSLEQVSPANAKLPLAWQSGGWGTNTAAFSYLKTGHTGSRSVKTTISGYTDGDAKWYFEPQPLLANQVYQFSDYYKSNIATQVVLEIRKAGGGIIYQSLRNADPATSWTKYSDTFTTPVDIASLTVFHLVAGVGWLITDDYSLLPYQPQPFNRPLISLTFDDNGWEDNYATVLPLLNDNGFRSTLYCTTSDIEWSENQYKLLAFATAGHEIGSHTVTHPHLPLLSAANLATELNDSKTFLENMFGTGAIKSFASPYGEYNSTVVSAVKNYYQSHRTVDAGYNTRNDLDPYAIKVQNILSSTTISEVNNWINQAKKDGSWLVLVYHRVIERPGLYDTTPANFAAQISSIKNSNIAVLPVSEALAELIPQKAL